MKYDTQRPPSDDEQKDDFVNGGEHEDMIWEELEKQEQKISDYFERQNEPDL